jgi:hypothetical protein
MKAPVRGTQRGVGTIRNAAGMGACATLLLLGASLAGGQRLPLEPLRNSGQGVTAAYEGWFRNPDGTFSILFGYYNRNQQQELDLPVGPNNRIEPGGPDQGQPTHFLPGRQWGMFTISVPSDFGNKKLTWTLVANGQTAEIPASLDPLWEVEPFKDANGNTPPGIRFENGAVVKGPRPATLALSAVLPEPLTLAAWISDDAYTVPGERRPATPAAILTWAKYRGPGEVTFGKAALEPGEGQAAYNAKSTTSVTFSEPGEYVLYGVVNDWSGRGGRGFQCCWTNAHVKVSVKPAK